MGSFFNGRFEKQRHLISRHFDKVVLARVLFVIIAVQFTLMWMLISALGATDQQGRMLGIVTDFASTMNNGITTVIGFIGGVITGVAMASSRAGDRPPAPGEEKPDASRV